MGQTVKLRRSAVSGKKPLNSQIELGELSVNTTDGKLFFAKSGSNGPSVEEIITTNTVNTGSVEVSGSFTVTGSITATEFTGSALGLTNVPLALSGSDAADQSIDGTFTRIKFDDSTGIKISGTTGGDATIFLSGVSSESESSEGRTAKLEVTSATSTWTLNHNLSEKHPSIEVFDSNDEVIIPQKIEATSVNQVVVTFATPQTGTVTATVGGGLPSIQNSYTGRVLSVDSSGNAIWKDTILSGSVDLSTLTDTGSFNTYTSSANGRLSSLETISGSHDGRLDSIELFTGSIDATYATDADVSAVINDFNSYTSSNNTTNTTQDGRLGSLETESGSIRTTFNSYTSSNDTNITTLDGRLDSIELFTGSIDSTYATDADVTALRNDLNTHTSSNNTTNTNQNGRLDSLEIKSGSQATSITNLQSFQSDVEAGIELTGSNVTVKGNLLVRGTETRVDSTTVDIADNIISLNGSGAVNAGIEVRDTESPGVLSGSLVYDTGDNQWKGGIKGSELRLLDTSDLSVINTTTSSLDSRLDQLETESGSIRTNFNDYTSSNDTTNTTQDGRLTSLETKTGSLDTTNTSQNNRLQSLETKTGSLNTKNTTQDGRLTSLETTSGSHDDRLNSLETTSGSHDGRLDTVEATNTTQNSRLTSLETTSGSHDGRLDSVETKTGSLETKNTTQDGRLTSLETKTGSLNTTNTEQDGRLDSIELFTGSLDATFASDSDVTAVRNDFNAYTSSNDTTNTNQNNRLGSLEVESGSIRTNFNNYTSSNNTTNTEQDGRLGSLETKTGSLDSDISTLDGRVDSIEVKTGSLETKNTTQDGRLGSLEVKTGSLDTTNTEQDGRLGSLETKTGSLTTDVSTLDGRVDSIEVKTGSLVSDISTLDGRVDSIEVKTGSLVSDISTLDGRLDSVEAVTGSYLTQHPSISAASSSDNSGRTYIQDIILDSNGHVTGLSTSTETVVNTDEFVTGATWNNSNAALTFTRNDGDTFNVTLLDTLSDVTVTGGTYNSGNQTLTLTKNDGNTVDVNGFAIDTDVNYYLTGATWATGTGILTLSVKDSSDVTVDLDGRYLTSYSETDTLDSVVERGSVTDNTITVNSLRTNTDSTYDIGQNATRFLNGYFDNLHVKDKLQNNTASYINYISNQGHRFYVDGNNDDTSHKFQILSNTNSYDASNVIVDIDQSGNATFDGNISGNNLSGTNTGDQDLSGYLTSFTETDPVFTAHVAHGITSTKISNWDTAYGWGDHSLGGYLTSFTETYTQHENINAASSSNNSGRTYIQDILLDDNGHVTGITTSSESVVNTDEFTTGATFNTSNGVVTFTRNDGDTFTVDIDGRFLTSYTETDTLQSVTDRGATTTNDITISNASTPKLVLKDTTNDLTGQVRVANSYMYLNIDSTDSVASTRLVFQTDGVTAMYLDQNQKATFEDDVNVNGNIDMGTNIITDTKVGQWDTAYGWGDHSGAGYLTSFTESDPIFTASAASGILTSDITNWNTAYGWGDHSLGGYLTSFTETYTQHENINAASSSNNSGRTYIQDILLDSNGHVTGLTTASESVVNTDEFTTGATFNSSNGVVTFTRNNGGDTFTVDLDGRYLTSFTETYTQHENINAASSSNNSGRTYVQDILLDSNGHITGITTATETVTDSGNDNDIDYISGASFNTGTGVITGTGTGNAGFTVDIDGRFLPLAGGTLTGDIDMASGKGITFYGNGSGDHGIFGHDSSGNAGDDIRINSYHNVHINLDSNNNNTTSTTFFTIGQHGGTGALGNVFTIDGSGNVVASGTITASGYNDSNWNTAYGWGDHSLGGYLTSFTESDPVFTAHAAFGVTTTKISNWDTAYGWGDHSQAGYLTSSSTQSKYLRSDTDDTTSGTLTIGDGSNQARLKLQKADNDTANHIEFYNGTTRVGEIGVQDTTWLRINQETNKNIYTPRYIRADAGFFVDGTSKGINGSGDFIGGKIIGASDANVTNWDTAYGWGDHSTAGYISSFTDTNEFTTGATFNGSNGIITFTRNNGGDTYTVDISSVLTDINVTGGTYNDANQTLTLNKSNGSSVDVTGFAVDTVLHTTGATFNTGNGIITFTKNGGATYTVDLDGKYAESGHNHDSTYLKLAGGTLTGQLTHTSDDFLRIFSSTNGAGAGISFSDHSSRSQYGSITYVHSDTASYGSGNAFIISGSEASMTILADGKLMYNEGIYSKPTSGTGAGTRKDSNWDTAYGWGDHSGAGYLTSFTETYTAHEDTSTLNGNYGGGNNGVVIEDITVDSNGHVTAVGTRDLDGRFMLQGQELSNPNTISNGGNRYNPNSNNPTNEHYAILTYGNGGNVTGQLATHFQTGDLYSRGHNNSWSTWKKYFNTDDFTTTNVSNWNTAYGWGDHSTAGYISSFTDTNEFVTGATFNSADGVITFTRNNGGDTFTVDIDGRYLTSESNSFLGDGGNASTHPGTSRVIYSGQVSAGTGALGMPTVDNSNSFLNFNRHAGEYNSQLGFSSNGHMYYRSFSNTAINGTQTWHKVYTENVFANNSGNWNTAYGWGDHSVAGYISSFTDTNEFVTGATFNSGNGIVTFTRNNGGDTFTVDIDGRYLTSFTESDPVFTASAAGGIASGDITNWDTAYGWGDHSTAGYISSADGGNATTLDGIDSSEFLRSNTADTFTGTITMGTQKALVANNYGRGVYGLYSASRYQHVWSMGTSYNLSDDGTSSGNLYGLAFTHTNVGGQSKSGLAHQLLIMDNGVTKSAIGRGIWTDGTITTTSHGDSSQWNTAYGWGNHASVGYLTSSSGLNASNINTGTFGDYFSPSTRYNIGLIDGYSSQTRDKLRVWDSGTYSIGMKSGYDYGHIGSGEYAMSFQMSNTDGRGWWWGDTSHSDDQGAASLTTTGKMVIAKSLSIGEGESVTNPSSTSLYVEGTTAGSTVFEVQGTLGQLFSVTDDLTGDIFEVSDISGVPILTVNSNGTVTVDDTLHVTGEVFAYYSSDERLKENIKPIENAIDKVKMIGGYEFDWNSLSRTNSGHDVGVIAQEIEKVLPELVTTKNDGFKGVRYEKLTSLLIQANKELIQRVEELEEKLNNGE